MAEHTFALSSDSPAADRQLRRPDVDTGVHHELAVGKRAPAVLIAESAEIPRLKRKTGFGKDLLVFSDSESLRAHDAIMLHRPSLVVLSELFAKTRRGAELIGRIQTDATLTHCQIRVLSDAGDYLLLVAERVTAGSSSTLEEPGRPLPPQYNGTRAAQRVRIGEGLEVRVDGNPVTLVDLSPTGAQCRDAAGRPGAGVPDRDPSTVSAGPSGGRGWTSVPDRDPSTVSAGPSGGRGWTEHVPVRRLGQVGVL